jgi:hypothetical protein
MATLRANYNLKNNSGSYDKIAFTTTADQIITDDQRQFVSQEEKDLITNHVHYYAGSNTAGGPALSAYEAKEANFATTADKANTLVNSRTINGTAFNGSANITTSNWGTARTITIGSTGKSVNGSGNVSWTLSEIGASPTSHTHTRIGDSSYYVEVSSSYIKLSAPRINLSGASISSDVFPDTTSYNLGVQGGNWWNQTNTTTLNTTTIKNSKNSQGPLISTFRGPTTYYTTNASKGSGMKFIGSSGPTAEIFCGSTGCALYSHSGYSLHIGAFGAHDTISIGTNYITITDTHYLAITRLTYQKSGGYLGNTWAIASLCHFLPDTNNKFALGSGSYRWNTIYLNSSPNVSSDKTLKTNIQYVDKAKARSVINPNSFHSFVKDELKIATYNMIDEDPKDITRTHKTNTQVGFIADDIVDTTIGSIFTERDEGGRLSYDLGSYVSVLAVALQEEIKKREALEQKVLALSK